MFWAVVVFLGHEHSLSEEILVHLLAVGFGDKPDSLVSLVIDLSRSKHIHCREFLALFGESRTILKM